MALTIQKEITYGGIKHNLRKEKDEKGFGLLSSGLNMHKLSATVDVTIKSAETDSLLLDRL